MQNTVTTLSNPVPSGSLIKRWFKWMHSGGEALNLAHITEGVRDAAQEISARQSGTLAFLDLGCNDGVWTQKLAAGTGLADRMRVSGVEIVSSQARAARALGIEVTEADLNQPFPYRDAQFDVVHSNQVIEHVGSIDRFVSELHRILKPGGWMIVSSENGSAWHNIAAAILGWQIFSLTNVSEKAGALGNPAAMHRGGQAFHAAWTHKTIFNYLGFKEIFAVHGFQKVEVKGAGYYPLPPILGKWDPRHAHFLTAIAQKPL